MSKKSTLPTTVRARQQLTVVELRAVAYEAALVATQREAQSLSTALDLIEEAERIALGVAETASSTVAGLEARAGAISLASAATHLRAALTALGGKS